MRIMYKIPPQFRELNQHSDSQPLIKKVVELQTCIFIQPYCTIQCVLTNIGGVDLDYV